MADISIKRVEPILMLRCYGYVHGDEAAAQIDRKCAPPPGHPCTACPQWCKLPLWCFTALF
ncbi:MAG: hypothetical protein ACOX8S_01500 [Christensenellales bacterium]